MIKILLIITSLVLLTSCMSHKYTTIEGDLYFQLIDLLKVYDAPDSIITRIETEFPKINIDTIPQNDRKFYDLVKYGIDNKLLRTPYIWLETKKGKKLMLFMDKDKFQQFDSLRCFDLREHKKKIHILAKAQNISYQDLTAFKVIELIKVGKIDGETMYKK